tara:strand:- start:3114 stop:3269 length:156 start_codon:yes stop_codon:yes gene_type:complete
MIISITAGPAINETGNKKIDNIKNLSQDLTLEKFSLNFKIKTEESGINIII